MEPEDQLEPAGDWRKPQVEQPGLQRYARTLRNGAPIIAITILVTTLFAGLYVATSSKRYRAEADLLVSPTSDAGLSALSGLIRSSSDPTRDVETAARLVTAVDVAERVRARLKLRESAESLLRDVRAEPVAMSNIVAITAQGSSPERARDTANAFGDAMVQDRTDQLHAQAAAALQRLHAIPAAERGTGTGSIADQISKLEQVLAGSDPTLTLETRAVAPTSAFAPRPALSIAAGILSGLLLGVAGVFALQALDPRLRREEQLQSLYRLPVLARIPDVRRRPQARFPLGRPRDFPEDAEPADGVPLAPQDVSLPMLEAYRTLRVTLAALRGDTTRARARTGARSLLVTSPSTGEGKSSVALNLAESLARAGSKVILIEADLHRPSIARALGIAVATGTRSVLLGTAGLSDALVRMDESGRLQLLLSEERGGSVSVADRLFLPAGRKLIATAKQRADYVVIDAPPLTSVIDALPLAQRADEVLIVLRLGTTQLAKLRELGDLLEQHAVTPIGFVTVGVPPTAPTSDYHYADFDAPALDWLPVKPTRRRSSSPDALQTANGQDGEPLW